LVRKKHVLSRLHDALAWQALPVVQLLAPDERVCMHLIGTLFGMLHSVEDSSVLDLFVEVLVRLVVELKSEQYLRCILDESQKELCKATTMRGSLPTFTLLGKLADAIPGFADVLVLEHGDLVDHLLMGLTYPNEGIKAAVCYLYGKLYSSSLGTERLSAHFEERLCGLFLNTLGRAQMRELQVNCLGLLKELLKSDHFVSILMNNSNTEEESENPDFLEGENPLPLVLKKLLLTRDEMLQAASSHCVAAVLVHSPSRYAPAFIHADVPEFLFECLSSNSEILIWSVYCCLLLLTEERLFFSKCNTVYGIESLVRSLRDILQLNNVELHKQGLLLFTEILKRQPVEIKLFTNRGVCVEAIDVLMATVNCPVLEVVVEAVRAVGAFLRKDHLSSPPVPYEELQKLLEAVLKRCADLSPRQSNKNHAGDLFSVSQSHPANRNLSGVPQRQGQFLLNTLESFRNACRLAVEFQSDPMAQENAFTAPNSRSKDTLSNFSEFLFRICDNLCIPMVMNYLERAVSPSMMEVFISTLNTLFMVVPNMRNKFSRKLASSSFIRLTLELKARFCSVQSNPALNQACSSFLCSLCLSLYSATEKERTSSQEDCKQTETEEAGVGVSDQLNSANPLLPILKSNSSILLILLDLVCSSSVEVAWKVLTTLRTFLERNEDVLVCDLLRSQFLQILQQLLVENSSATLQANRNLPVLLSLLFLVQLRTKGVRELDSTDFKLLHQVSNLCGKCRPRHTDLLQPSFNFLYWSLHQTTPCSQERAVAVLLSNVSLLELLQKILECTWLRSPLSEPAYLSSEDALLCSGWLLVASLLLYQHRYNSEVHQTLSLDITEVLNAVIFRKKKPILLLVSIMQFLRAVLRQNFSSSLLVIVGKNTAQDAMQPQPSSLQDAALHPLDLQRVLSLVVSLQNLLVHKDLLLSQAVVACLETLVEYLYVKNQDVALHVASQPWHRFLLFVLLSGGQKSFLQPEVLRLMTLFLKYQSSNIISQKEISQILQEAAEANLAELPEASTRALHLFLCQIQSSHCQVEPGQSGTIQTLLERLLGQRTTCVKHQDIV
ncbi:PREDICTED: meiosis inhibitor protein 1, partial [Buceros rhinoceros silvestris]|uniref:meiosis inhibitor protein 1 n=1 Tax=Buceros rhinoceros silvestris TaxID=175836 RepID=UPI0005280AFF